MFPDASLDDLPNVFVGLIIVLQAVVTQGDVVGQSCDREEGRDTRITNLNSA